MNRANAPREPAAAEPTPIAVPADALRDFSWKRLFGRDRPVEVEIGCGKGGFLLRRSAALPETNFLGIEWASEFYRFAIDRMRRRGAANVRILRADAARFIREVCPRDSLTALHIYHPDPWPKRRHNRRRLIQPEFIAAATACLVPGGRLAVQTDHAEYFEVIAELLRAAPGLMETEFDDPRFGVDASRVQTNFEIKYVREGRDIYQIAMRRSDAPTPRREAGL